MPIPNYEKDRAHGYDHLEEACQVLKHGEYKVQFVRKSIRDVYPDNLPVIAFPEPETVLSNGIGHLMTALHIFVALDPQEPLDDIVNWIDTNFPDLLPEDPF